MDYELWAESHHQVAHEKAQGVASIIETLIGFYNGFYSLNGSRGKW